MDELLKLCRPFKLPALLPYEDLIAKYEGELEISTPWKDARPPSSSASSYTHGHGRSNGRATRASNRLSNINSNNKKEVPDSIYDNGISNSNSSVRLATASGNDGSDDSFDCTVISDASVHKPFKTPIIKRTSTRNSSGLNVEQAPNAFNSRDQTSANKDDDSFIKPLPPKQDTARGKRQRSDQGYKRPVSSIDNPAKIIEKRPEYGFIDTKGFVNSNMVLTTVEFCQRAKIADIPDDPTELLMDFSLIVPKIDPRDLQTGLNEE